MGIRSRVVFTIFGAWVCVSVMGVEECVCVKAEGGRLWRWEIMEADGVLAVGVRVKGGRLWGRKVWWVWVSGLRV